jgi:hypothetical protein
MLIATLTKWADENSVLIDNQYDFRKSKSTHDCAFILHAIILKTLSMKKKLYETFLDWEKMFDRIDRVTLWQKLITANISTKLFPAFKSITCKICNPI